MENRGKRERMQILFSWAPKSLWTVTASKPRSPALQVDSLLAELQGSSDVSWTIKKAERQRTDAFEL